MRFDHFQIRLITPRDTAAYFQLMDHYFRELQFNKLFLRTHPTNTACRMLAERCGFEQEGLIRKDYKTTHGELVDLIYYGKLGDL